MNFSEIVAGKKLRKTIMVDFGGEKAIPIDLRKLSVAESGEILARARAFAKAKGVEDPTDGNPIYDYAFRIETVAFVCVESESPKDAPVRFFKSSAQIYETDLISEDVIQYIFAAFELFADETSLQKRELAAPEMLRVIVALGGGDFLPFIELSPAMRCSLARSMALQLLSAQLNKSPSSSLSLTETPPNDDVRGHPGGEHYPAG